MATHFRLASFLAILIALCGVEAAQAKVIAVTVNAPPQVIINEPFDVEVRVSTDSGGPPLPEVPPNPDVTLSLQTGFQSTEIINGRITQVYRYTGRILKRGTFALAGIKAGGMTAAPQKIIGIDASEVAASNRGRRTPIFIEANLDKKEIWQGGQILYDLYLYMQNVRPTRLGANIEEVLQPFGATKIEEADMPRVRQSVPVDGQKYERQLVARYVLFPFEPGEITIPPVRLQGSVQTSRSDDPFDRFFSFANGVEIEKVCGGPVVTQPIKIKVKPLPEEGRPQNFSGAVGQQFTFSADIKKRDVAVGEAFTLVMRIKGSGNLDSIKQPALNFPDWIEIFETERKPSKTFSEDRLFGEVVYEYTLIARKEGKVVLNPVEFSYFSSGDGKYVTLKQGPFNLNVTPDEGQSVTYLQGKRKRIRVTGEDFRHIRTTGIQFQDELTPAWELSGFWALLASPWAIALGLAARNRRRNYLERNPDVSARIKARGHVKVHLGKAEKLIGDEGGEFYNALESAVHEQLTAQRKTPTRGMTREQISKLFVSPDGQPLEINLKLAALLDELDQARFMPGSSLPELRQAALAKTRQFLEEARKLK